MHRLRRRVALALLCGMASYWYVSSTVIFPPQWADGSAGVAVVEITDLSSDNRYGRAFCKMKLDLLSFEPETCGFFAQNIPCKWVCNDPVRRPKAGFRYKVYATLHEHEGSWKLKIPPGQEWVKLCHTFSLVEWRLQAKAYFKKLMARHLSPGQARAFLEGVLIGEFHDTVLATSLRRFGLQHILVVSGFHFSLITAIFALFLRQILPWKATTGVLLVATGAYLLFVGASASVLRAWCSVFILLLSKLLNEKSNGLNCLGIGLIVVLLMDPTCATGLSFQLSFLATLAILLLYPFFSAMLRKFSPPRSGVHVFRMPFCEQLMWVFFSFFRASFALVFAVSLLVLPMSLFVFHSFPLMGIVYNCFFPFLVSIAVFFLCVALLFSWLTPVATLFFSLATWLTESLLTLVTHAPSWLDMTICWGELTITTLVLYLCFVVFFGIRFLLI